MGKFGGVGDSTCKGVLYGLQPVQLVFREIIVQGVTVVKFGMDY